MKTADWNSKQVISSCVRSDNELQEIQQVRPTQLNVLSSAVDISTPLISQSKNNLMLRHKYMDVTVILQPKLTEHGLFHHHHLKKMTDPTEINDISWSS